MVGADLFLVSSDNIDDAFLKIVGNAVQKGGVFCTPYFQARRVVDRYCSTQELSRCSNES